MMISPSPFVPSFLLLLYQPYLSGAQQTITGTYSGAFQAVVNGNSGSYQPASQAVCPSNAPVSCTNIGQPDWCCPTGNTCGWNGGSVGCCAWGSSCSSSGGGGGAAAGGYNTWQQSSWQPTTYWQPQQTQTVYQQPTTVYEQPPATTYYAGGGAGAYQTTQAVQQQSTEAQQYNGYCSTLYEKGPNLPTTAAGQCGTVLILNSAGARFSLGCTRVAFWGAGATMVHLIVGSSLIFRL